MLYTPEIKMSLRDKVSSFTRSRAAENQLEESAPCEGVDGRDAGVCTGVGKHVMPRVRSCILERSDHQAYLHEDCCGVQHPTFKGRCVKSETKMESLSSILQHLRVTQRAGLPFPQWCKLTLQFKPGEDCQAGRKCEEKVETELALFTALRAQQGLPGTRLAEESRWRSVSRELRGSCQGVLRL